MIFISYFTESLHQTFLVGFTAAFFPVYWLIFYYMENY